MTNNYIAKGLLLLNLFLIISCSKEIDAGLLKSSSINENFVELSTAEEIAGSISFDKKDIFLRKNGSAANITKTITNINEVKNDSGSTSFYIINYNEGGFILLSADNRINPILAFSENGIFSVDENTHAAGLKYWITETAKQIDDLQHSNAKQNEIIKMLWKNIALQSKTTTPNMSAKPPVEECYDHTETNIVGPFLNMTWNQQGTFNDALPHTYCNGTYFEFFAGCVPIAMAQIMKFHNYPNTYNWSAMPPEYGSAATADLILDIHNSIRAVYSGYPSYSCTETGVPANADMGKILKNYFNYTSADFGDYNEQILKDNLNAGRPVLLSGSGSTAHMWICDGYFTSSYFFDDCTGGSSLMFSMKWGWLNGVNNGWYSFNNFNPGSSSYNNNKKMIYNIIP